MENKDIRWIQRFNNYRKALKRLGQAVNIDIYRMSDLEKEGLIQRFEYTYELAWKTMQDYVLDNGYSGERGKPNIIISYTASIGFINEDAWRKMTHSRNQMSHDYDEEKMIEIAEAIAESYHDLFIQLETRLQIEKLNKEKEGK